MRFKVQRTLLGDATSRPYANSDCSPNPVQRGEDDWWYVEIADLDELLAFTSRHGELIIGTDDTDHYIEIYDADREWRSGDPARVQKPSSTLEDKSDH